MSESVEPNAGQGAEYCVVNNKIYLNGSVIEMYFVFVMLERSRSDACCVARLFNRFIEYSVTIYIFIYCQQTLLRHMARRKTITEHEIKVDRMSVETIYNLFQL